MTAVLWKHSEALELYSGPEEQGEYAIGYLEQTLLNHIYTALEGYITSTSITISRGWEPIYHDWKAFLRYADTLEENKPATNNRVTKRDRSWIKNAAFSPHRQGLAMDIDFAGGDAQLFALSNKQGLQTIKEILEINGVWANIGILCKDKVLNGLHIDIATHELDWAMLGSTCEEPVDFTIKSCIKDYDTTIGDASICTSVLVKPRTPVKNLNDLYSLMVQKPQWVLPVEESITTFNAKGPDTSLVNETTVTSWENLLDYLVYHKYIIDLDPTVEPTPEPATFIPTIYTDIVPSDNRFRLVNRILQYKRNIYGAS